MAVFKKYKNQYGNWQTVEVLRPAKTEGYTFCKNERGVTFMAVTSGLKNIEE